MDVRVRDPVLGPVIISLKLVPGLFNWIRWNLRRSVFKNLGLNSKDPSILADHLSLGESFNNSESWFSLLIIVLNNDILELN